MPLTKVTVVSVVVPSLKVTVPVGTPMLPVTVAVKVTDWPVVIEADDVPSVVLLVACTCT